MINSENNQHIYKITFSENRQTRKKRNGIIYSPLILHEYSNASDFINALTQKISLGYAFWHTPIEFSSPYFKSINRYSRKKDNFRSTSHISIDIDNTGIFLPINASKEEVDKVISKVCREYTSTSGSNNTRVSFTPNVVYETASSRVKDIKKEENGEIIGEVRLRMIFVVDEYITDITMYKVLANEISKTIKDVYDQFSIDGVSDNAAQLMFGSFDDKGGDYHRSYTYINGKNTTPNSLTSLIENYDELYINLQKDKEKARKHKVKKEKTEYTSIENQRAIENLKFAFEYKLANVPEASFFQTNVSNNTKLSQIRREAEGINNEYLQKLVDFRNDKIEKMSKNSYEQAFLDVKLTDFDKEIQDKEQGLFSIKGAINKLFDEKISSDGVENLMEEKRYILTPGLRFFMMQDEGGLVRFEDNISTIRLPYERIMKGDFYKLQSNSSFLDVNIQNGFELLPLNVRERVNQIPYITRGFAERNNLINLNFIFLKDKEGEMYAHKIKDGGKRRVSLFKWGLLLTSMLMDYEDYYDDNKCCFTPLGYAMIAKNLWYYLTNFINLNEDYANTDASPLTVRDFVDIFIKVIEYDYTSDTFEKIKQEALTTTFNGSEDKTIITNKEFVYFYNQRNKHTNRLNKSKNITSNTFTGAIDLVQKIYLEFTDDCEKMRERGFSMGIRDYIKLKNGKELYNETEKFDFSKYSILKEWKGGKYLSSADEYCIKDIKIHKPSEASTFFSFFNSDILESIKEGKLCIDGGLTLNDEAFEQSRVEDGYNISVNEDNKRFCYKVVNFSDVFSVKNIREEYRSGVKNVNGITKSIRYLYKQIGKKSQDKYYLLNYNYGKAFETLMKSRVSSFDFRRCLKENTSVLDIYDEFLTSTEVNAIKTFIMTEDQDISDVRLETFGLSEETDLNFVVEKFQKALVFFSQNVEGVDKVKIAETILKINNAEKLRLSKEDVAKDIDYLYNVAFKVFYTFKDVSVDMESYDNIHILYFLNTISNSKANVSKYMTSNTVKMIFDFIRGIEVLTGGGLTKSCNNSSEFQYDRLVNDFVATIIESESKDFVDNRSDKSYGSNIELISDFVSNLQIKYNFFKQLGTNFVLTKAPNTEYKLHNKNEIILNFAESIQNMYYNFSRLLKVLNCSTKEEEKANEGLMRIVVNLVNFYSRREHCNLNFMNRQSTADANLSDLIEMNKHYYKNNMASSDHFVGYFDPLFYNKEKMYKPLGSANVNKVSTPLIYHNDLIVDASVTNPDWHQELAKQWLEGIDMDEKECKYFNQSFDMIMERLNEYIFGTYKLWGKTTYDKKKDKREMFMCQTSQEDTRKPFYLNYRPNKPYSFSLQKELNELNSKNQEVLDFFDLEIPFVKNEDKKVMVEKINKGDWKWKICEGYLKEINNLMKYKANKPFYNTLPIAMERQLKRLDISTNLNAYMLNLLNANYNIKKDDMYSYKDVVDNSMDFFLDNVYTRLQIEAKHIDFKTFFKTNLLRAMKSFGYGIGLSDYKERLDEQISKIVEKIDFEGVVLPNLLSYVTETLGNYLDTIYEEEKNEENTESFKSVLDENFTVYVEKRIDKEMETKNGENIEEQKKKNDESKKGKYLQQREKLRKRIVNQRKSILKSSLEEQTRSIFGDNSVLGKISDKAVEVYHEIIDNNSIAMNYLVKNVIILDRKCGDYKPGEYFQGKKDEGYYYIDMFFDEALEKTPSSFTPFLAEIRSKGTYDDYMRKYTEDTNLKNHCLSEAKNINESIVNGTLSENSLRTFFGYVYEIDENFSNKGSYKYTTNVRNIFGLGSRGDILDVDFDIDFSHIMKRQNALDTTSYIHRFRSKHGFIGDFKCSNGNQTYYVNGNYTVYYNPFKIGGFAKEQLSRTFTNSEEIETYKKMENDFLYSKFGKKIREDESTLIKDKRQLELNHGFKYIKSELMVDTFFDAMIERLIGLKGEIMDYKNKTKRHKPYQKDNVFTNFIEGFSQSFIKNDESTDKDYRMFEAVISTISSSINLFTNKNNINACVNAVYKTNSELDELERTQETYYNALKLSSVIKMTKHNPSLLKDLSMRKINYDRNNKNEVTKYVKLFNNSSFKTPLLTLRKELNKEYAKIVA